MSISFPKILARPSAEISFPLHPTPHKEFFFFFFLMPETDPVYFWNYHGGEYKKKKETRR